MKALIWGKGFSVSFRHAETRLLFGIDLPCTIVPSTITIANSHLYAYKFSLAISKEMKNEKVKVFPSGHFRTR